MASCKVCLVAIKKNQLKLSCEDCQANFHAKCVGMSQADVECLNEINSVWRCDPCSVERRKSMRMDLSIQEGKLTLEDLMKVLTDIREDQKATKQDFNTLYEALHQKLDENTVSLENALKKVEDFSKKIDVLQAENSVLKRKVTELEDRVDDMEQYSWRNCLEIQGIPEEKNESVLEIVKDVGHALNMEITDGMVDTCHRLGQKNGSYKGPRGIIVKFVSRIDKEELLRKRREKKRDFSTRHLNLRQPSDNPVFLNESLSPMRRRLFGKVRSFKKDYGYKYLWMRNGTILLRKEEGYEAVQIKNQAELDKLCT